MSCTRLLRCQLTALAVDRQEQENKTLLILPHSQTHSKTSGQTRLFLANVADGICFRRVRLRGSISRGGGCSVSDVNCFRVITCNIYSLFTFMACLEYMESNWVVSMSGDRKLERNTTNRSSSLNRRSNKIDTTKRCHQRQN